MQSEHPRVGAWRWSIAWLEQIGNFLWSEMGIDKASPKLQRAVGVLYHDQNK